MYNVLIVSPNCPVKSNIYPEKSKNLSSLILPPTGAGGNSKYISNGCPFSVAEGILYWILIVS